MPLASPRLWPGVCRAPNWPSPSSRHPWGRENSAWSMWTACCGSQWFTEDNEGRLDGFWMAKPRVTPLVLFDLLLRNSVDLLHSWCQVWFASQLSLGIFLPTIANFQFICSDANVQVKPSCIAYSTYKMAHPVGPPGIIYGKAQCLSPSKVPGAWRAASNLELDA